MRLGQKPQSGTSLRRGECGTNDLLKGPKAGLSGSEKRSSAPNVKTFFRPSSERVETLKSIAPQNVRSQHTANGRENGSVIIESVKKLNYRQDVWCITVPEAGEFSLANGAIVHNCDAFGLMACVAERLMSRTPNKIPRHEFADVAGGWMS
jgi:hypothetical protein